MDINELKSYLESYCKKNNIFKKFSLATQDTNKSSENPNPFTIFADEFHTLNKVTAKQLMDKIFNILEKEKFAKFFLEHENIETIDKKITELFDYMSELKQDIYADTMIISVDIANKWKRHPSIGTLITRKEHGDLKFDNKPILEIPSKYLKEMSNKIIIYNSGRFIWNTNGLSVDDAKLRDNNYKVKLRSWHDFTINPKYTRIINLID